LLMNLNGRAAEAEQKFEAALRIRPADATALSNYGVLLTNLDGRAAEAEQKFEAALRIRPDDAGTLCNYAVLLWQKLRDYPKAKGLFVRAFAADPKHSVIAKAYETFLLDERNQRP